MKTFQELQTDIQNTVFDTTAASLAIFKARINEGRREVARLTDGVFLNKTYNFFTNANQQFYGIPNDVDKIRDIGTYVGTLRYVPKECSSKRDWDILNQYQYKSDYSTDYFIDNNISDPLLGNGTLTTVGTAATLTGGLTSQFSVGDTIVVSSGTQSGENTTVTVIGTTTTFTLNSAFTTDVTNAQYLILKSSVTGMQLGLFPRPVNVRNVIVAYKQKLIDLYADDYTTGTIVSIANGGTALVGSGTTWTKQMEGRIIRITATNSANTGDQADYVIQTYNSATSLTLARPYQGNTISAGAATYRIGQPLTIPEAYENILLDYVCMWFYRRLQDTLNAQIYEKAFYDKIQQIKADYTNQSDYFVLDDGIWKTPYINPNLLINY